MKKFAGITMLFLVIAGFAGFLFATQDSTLSNVEVRDPRRLEPWLEANALDAETRLAAAEAGTSIPLANTKILVGNAGGTGTAVVVSGDATLANTGALTINNVSVQADDIALANGTVLVGDAGGTGTAVTVSGDITIGNTGVAAIQDLAVADNDIAIANTKIIVGNAGGTGTAVVVSGDATLANDGALTISASAVEEGMIALADATILVGNAGGTSAAVTVSGDITIGNTGVAAIQDLAVADNDIALANTKIIVGNAGGTGTAVVVSSDATLAADGALTLAAESVDSAEYVDGSIDLVHLNDSDIAGAAGGTATAASSLVNYFGSVRYDLVTFTNVVHTLTNGADNADSSAVISFPAGRILILGCTVNATVVNSEAVFEASANDIFYVSIGSVAAANDGTLSGTEQDFAAVLEIDTTDNTANTNQWEADFTAGADSVWDGTATSVTAYVNSCVADTSLSNDCTVTVTGVVGFHYIVLGDD